MFVVIPEGLAEKDKDSEDWKTWDKVTELCRHLSDHLNKIYIACIDNYFTYPKTIKALAHLNVATVGMACSSTMLPKICDCVEEKKEYQPLKTGQKDETEDTAKALSI